MSVYSEPQPGNSPAEASRPMSPIIENLLAQVHRKIEAGHEVLEQASDLAFISHSLQAMKDMDNGVLRVVREAGILTFEFHPPVDIPVHTDKAIRTIQDEELASAVAVIGSHVGESFIRNHTTLATQGQVLENVLTGAALIQPAVEDVSVIGFLFFQSLDDFDKVGAVINGKPMDTIRAIDIQEAGPSFLLTRSKLTRTDKMVNTITLSDIDSWRLGRLAAIGPMARDAKIGKDTLQNILAGVRLNPIFSK